MSSTLRRGHRAWLLKAAFVLVACFAAGLVTAGIVSGAGPLGALSSVTDPGTTDTETTETTTEPEATEPPAESEPTEPTPTETETTETTETETTETTETEATPPTATTQAVVAEKDDYVPNEIVTLWGSGWAADETVEIFVNDDEGKSWSHAGTATADALGAFMYEFRLPDWFVATYYVTATGASGVVVNSTFADSVALGGSSTNSNGGSGMASQEIAISAPAVAAGDVLVAQIVVTDSITSTVICPASGWTSIRNNNRDDKLRQHTFWYRASAVAGATSHIWTLRNSTCGGGLVNAGTKGASGGVIRYTGVIASGDPVDVSAGSAGSSSGPFNAPAVTPTTANTKIIRYFGVFKNTDVTGANRIYHVASATTKERAAAAFDGGTHAIAATSTGTFTAGLASTAEFASQTIALKPTVLPVTAAPTVNSPICAGATAVSGSSSEASGTTIEVFKTNVSVGTTMTSGGTWLKSGLSPALAAGDVIKATATAVGKTVSGPSNSVIVTACNAAPAAAANLAQFRSNGSTAIALGGFTNESTVVLKADVSDPDTNDSVKLEIEVKPVATPFDGSGLVAGPAVTAPATAAATVSGLADGGYHWRVRAVDDDNVQGPWTSFGGNAESTADFMVDTVNPTLTASATSPPVGPAYTAGMWTNEDVRVAFACQDGGSGVGTDTVPDVDLSTEGENQSVTSTGICADNAGNQAAPATFSDIDIDKTAPLVNCGSADSNWHATDVSIACTASDPTSGLASSGDAGFSLTTNVPAGTETDTAATDSRVVTDHAGNSTTAGPIGGNKIDKKDPVVNCTVPDQSAWYGANVDVTCTATDGGSGLANTADTNFTLSTSVAPGSEDAIASTPSKTVADGVGNDDTVGPFTFKVDRKDPTVTCTVPNQSAWYGSDVTVACTASDSGSDLANGADASFSLSTSVAPGTEDATAQTPDRTVADNAGNDVTVGPYTFKVDRKDPTVTCTPPNDAVWYGDNVSVPCTASDSGSGLADTGDASFSLTTSAADGFEDPAALTGTENVADGVGNSDTAGPYTFKVDRKAPQLSGCDAPDGNWHATDVTLHCTYADGGSGPASQQVALSTDVPADTETANAAASAGGDQACDAVDNCAATPADIGGNKVDKKDPVVNCTVPDQSAWYGANVDVTCTASDGGSGLANTTDANFTLSTSVAAGDEDATASTQSKTVADGVGNDDTVGPFTFKIDRKDPTVTCTVPDQSVWYGSDRTVSCTASDSGSGLANASDASFSLSTSVAAGTEDASAPTPSKTVADKVGNDDTVGPYTFKVDRKAPTVSCGTADGTWHANDASIACTASDGGSGLANAGDAAFSLTTSVPAGTETANAATGSRAVADGVGNSATAGPISGNKVDKKGPVVTLSCAATVVLGSSASASWTATDGGSGVKAGFGSGTIALDTSSVGAKTATVPAGTSQDNVDNPSAAAACGYSVVFAFQGFFQPVDNAPVFNVVQAGRAIPVKFSLGGDQGLDIMAPLYPKSTVVSCSGGYDTDALEETVTAGSSTLTYDPTANPPFGQYVYVWKTDKGWASTCRRLDVKLVDGTTRSAFFSFKK